MRHLARLWPYIRRYRSAYLSGIAMVLLGSAFGTASPFLIKAAVDGLEAGTAASLGWLVGALAMLGAAKALVFFRGRYSIVSASREVERDLREDFYRKLTRLDVSFFDRHSSGDIHSRAVNDMESVRMVAGISVMITAGSSLLLLLSLAAMFAIDAGLAAAAMVPLLLVCAVTALSEGRIYAQSERVQDILAELSTLAQENFSGARVVRAFARETTELRRFSYSSRSYLKASLALALTRGAAWGLMVLLMEATLGVTLLLGGLGIIRGTLSKGDFVAFTAYQFMLVWPVIGMGWVVTLVQRGAACMARINAVLDAPEEEHGAKPCVLRGCRIEFRDLTFRYSEDRPPALSGVSFTLEPGERAAVVGRTGSGKSTLLQLLLGLYRPPAGTVFLDGRDINDIPRAALRAAMACAPQDAFLFSDTLLSNIAFGAEGEASREAVLAAAEASRLSEDLDAFPGGIDQVIGERGITLSGGQRQRTSLARALLRKPPLLLLDDTLSSVDVHTEAAILQRLDPHLEGRTCILVTHRFSSLAKARRILVLDEGRLVEDGTHDALLASKGFYARLAARQRLEEDLSSAS
ncbi:MAG: ABC transporter ATP-binding protein [Elusimicrobiota bacterium]